MTLTVIFRSVFLARRHHGREALDTAVPVEIRRTDVAIALASLDQLVTSNLKLMLLFPGCHAAAAPFVLFRLKREGYSNCTAIATREGLVVRANR